LKIFLRLESGVKETRSASFQVDPVSIYSS